MEKINKNTGIFILNYNGLNWLKKTLGGIIKYSSNTNIVIIDNNSYDGSIEFIKLRFPQIELRVNSENIGFSKAYNKVLLNERRFDYFVLLNNDVLVTKDWLQGLRELTKHEDIGIIQPKIKNFSLNNKNNSDIGYSFSNFFDYAGAAGGFIDKIGIPFCRGRILQHIEKDTGQYDQNIEIFWASGACFLIKSKLFHKLNGFDEDLFMHHEEIDLCWRAQEFNEKIFYCSSSTIYHYGGGTLEESNPIKKFYNHRNNLLINIKNLPLNLLITILPIRIIIDYSLIIRKLNNKD